MQRLTNLFKALPRHAGNFRPAPAKTPFRPAPAHGHIADNTLRRQARQAPGQSANWRFACHPRQFRLAVNQLAAQTQAPDRSGRIQQSEVGIRLPAMVHSLGGVTDHFAKTGELTVG